MSASFSWLCGRLSAVSDWNQLGTQFMRNSASLDVSRSPARPALSILQRFPPSPLPAPRSFQLCEVEVKKDMSPSKKDP